MSKSLFDDDNGQNSQPMQLNPSQVLPKNTRKKITLLDDIDELNERINGPGANEQIIKAQEVLLKTYEFMKSDENLESQTEKGGKKTYEEMRRESRKKQANDHQKQNVDNVNFQKFEKPSTLQDQLKGIKGPRIIVTMKKINLSKDPNPSDFYLKGLEYVFDENDGTRAPTNSVFQNKQEGLFSKALTDRRGLPVSVKGQKTSNDPSLRK